MTVARTFFICCHIWVKRGPRDLHLVRLRIADFRENRRREGHDFFLIGVREITIALVPLNCITFESKERVGKVCVCVLRHTFAVLLCCDTLPLQIFQTSCSTFAFCSLRKRCEEYRLSLLHSLNATA